MTPASGPRSTRAASGSAIHCPRRYSPPSPATANCPRRTARARSASPSSSPCTERQQLRQGERITGLLSQGSAFGLLGNSTAEDTLSEGGQYYSGELGGPSYYYWIQSRLGQVTVAVSGRGSQGRSGKEVDAALQQGVGQMLTLTESELEGPR
ncbi:hypothetical protein [Streptomyces sp. NPDC097610]|uniref:hypothetical protein n=1 Tax=Streptomyces sp. NPDC097610 TaxID=3157227 RepID=UPI00331804F5